MNNDNNNDSFFINGTVETTNYKKFLKKFNIVEIISFLILFVSNVFFIGLSLYFEALSKDNDVLTFTFVGVLTVVTLVWFCLGLNINKKIDAFNDKHQEALSKRIRRYLSTFIIFLVYVVVFCLAGLPGWGVWPDIEYVIICEAIALVLGLFISFVINKFL